MLERKDWFDSLFHDFLGLRDVPMDVRENDNGFEVEVDLPGVEPADIDIQVLDGKLYIKAERKWAKSGVKAAFSRSFHETFVLPTSVDSSGITATYTQGVLKVAIPKRTDSSARKVEVKAV